jgi:hypothetical protein
MAILAFILFFVFIGLAKKILTFQRILRGFIPFLVPDFLWTDYFLGWKALLLLYPQYNDLQMVLPIMVTPILLLLYFYFSDNFVFYSRSASKKGVNHYVAPLFIWLILNLLLAVYLKGAGF